MSFSKSLMARHSQHPEDHSPCKEMYGSWIVLKFQLIKSTLIYEKEW